MANKYASLEERFFSQIEKSKDGCWNWTGSGNGRYGQISVNGRLEKAHRVSYKMHNGEIPEGLYICHKCDNTLCVNPDHLFAGTQQENLIDMNNKGRNTLKNDPSRAACGSDAGSAKLTDIAVMDIRSRYKKGPRHTSNTHDLAKEYGVDDSTIRRILSRTTWRHVKNEIRALAAELEKS